MMMAREAFVPVHEQDEAGKRVIVRDTAGLASFGPNGAPLGWRWWSTLRSSSCSYQLHSISHYLVKARNQAEWTELSRTPPPRVDICLVGSPRACHVFEWAVAQPIVHNDPRHYIDLLLIRALTSARAFAAATCRPGPRARRQRYLNILMMHEPMGLSSRHWLICYIENLRTWAHRELNGATLRT